MSVDLNTAIDQARVIAEPALKATVDQLKDQFLQAFGELKDASHKAVIEKIFVEAGEVKIKAFMAKTPEEQRSFARAYELKLKAIETYVLAIKIVADAKAASLFKEMMKQVLDTLGVVAMNILKTVVSGLITGAISGLTGGMGGPLAAMAVGAIGTALQPKPTG